MRKVDKTPACYYNEEKRSSPAYFFNHYSKGADFLNNPMLSRMSRATDAVFSGEAASYSGIAIKSTGLVLIVAASAVTTWLTGYATPTTTMVTAVMGLITALIVSFKPGTAGLLAPLYAILEGMCLACLSVTLAFISPYILVNAVMLTFGIAIAAGLVYARGLVTVNSKFMRITMIALTGVVLTYIAEMVLGFFGIHFPMLHDGGIVAIAIELVIIGVATLCLFMDYELINRSVQEGLPKDYEWYCAFSLLVTLIWLYVEILDLLRMLSGRD